MTAPLPIKETWHFPLSLEQYRTFDGDHSKALWQLSAAEMRSELYYLISGVADVRDQGGVSLGLPPHLTQRLKEIEHLIFCQLFENWATMMQLQDLRAPG